MVILIRTTYRVVEFSTGTRSDIADNETLFFVLEGTMVLIAVIALTVFHPGISFQGRWPEADFQFRTKSKEDTASVEIFQTQEMVVEGNA